VKQETRCIADTPATAALLRPDGVRVASQVVPASAPALRLAASPASPDIPPPVEIAPPRPTSSRVRYRAEPADIPATGFPMKYMMMMAEPEHHIAQRRSADAPAYWAAWGAFAKAINESGLVIEGHALQERTTATTLRSVNGKRVVQDGPFADAKEQLAGYFILDVPNIDAVLEWAAQVPGVDTGTVVEIRPILTV
jgi:hypothetical protein